MAARFLGLGLLCLSLASTTGCRTPPAPFYPIGIYAVPDTNDFRVVREAGFNAITGSATAGTLDAAKASGLKVLATPARFGGKGLDTEAARQAVRQFDRHPALWAWYLVDEPDRLQIPPPTVESGYRTLKRAGAAKPVGVVLCRGGQAGAYQRACDVLLLDRYPISWLPLANFNQHLRLARLAAGPDKPLVAIIQSFDWSYYPEQLTVPHELRPPTGEELRCMTYGALVQGVNGLFYYAYADSRWSIRNHPETWDALQRTVREVNERLPLFQARPLWWPHDCQYAEWPDGWNEALEGAVQSALVRVDHGNATVPPGRYVVAVNTTGRTLPCRLSSPEFRRLGLPVLGEGRQVRLRQGGFNDTFGPYAVHVYGPL